MSTQEQHVVEIVFYNLHTITQAEYYKGSFQKNCDLDK